MLIREATAADVQRVRELATATGRGSWSADVFTAAPNRLVLVAEMTGKLVGATKTHFHERADGDVPAGHYLGGIIVDPAYRRQGFGAALTRARMEWIGSHTDAAFYFTNEHNTASIRLHEAFGFRPPRQLLRNPRRHRRRRTLQTHSLHGALRKRMPLRQCGGPVLTPRRLRQPFQGPLCRTRRDARP